MLHLKCPIGQYSWNHIAFQKSGSNQMFLVVGIVVVRDYKTSILLI
jgi:hypothetical protein